ncbi:MAG TPA: hypothetical protein VGL77_06510 [Armatimonadota bacterium]
MGESGHHSSYAGRGTGGQALESAVEALQLGRAELILAVDVDAISEGACVLVLETADHAALRA